METRLKILVLWLAPTATYTILILPQVTDTDPGQHVVCYRLAREGGGERHDGREDMVRPDVTVQASRRLRTLWRHKNNPPRL